MAGRRLGKAEKLSWAAPLPLNRKQDFILMSLALAPKGGGGGGEHWRKLISTCTAGGGGGGSPGMGPNHDRLVQITTGSSKSRPTPHGLGQIATGSTAPLLK